MNGKAFRGEKIILQNVSETTPPYYIIIFHLKRYRKKNNSNSIEGHEHEYLNLFNTHILRLTVLV